MSGTTVIPSRRKLRIILVEDEKTLAELLEFCIRQWFQEIEVLPFEDGDAAWRELSRTEPDLLITDFYHPGMNGGMLISKLAEKRVKYPVLFTTAEATLSPDFAALGIKVLLLPKPFLLEPLWQALHELVGPCDFPVDHLDSSKFRTH